MAREYRWARAQGRFWRSAFALPHVKPSRVLALWPSLWLVVALVTSPALMADRARAAAGGGASGAEFYVGSFASSGTTGEQGITGIGFTPKAIIFWTSGSAAASGTWAAHVVQGIGFTSGPAESYAVGGGSVDNFMTSDTDRRIAAKAITLTNASGVVSKEADLSSFDASGFTLNWTTGSAIQRVVCFLAIGGSGVQAKAVNWTSPSATGNTSVTGVGFAPDVALHAATAQMTVPQSNSHMLIGLGVMDAAGGQWCNAVQSEDNAAAANSNRYQRTDKCVALVNSVAAVVEQAEFVSMDASGFTLNFTTAQTNLYQYISLCLSGVSAKAGAFNKTTSAAPVSQAVTGVGFEPSAVLLSTFNTTARTTVDANAAWAMGATDGTRERSTAQYDSNTADPTQADSVFFNDKLLTVVQNGPATNSIGDLTSFDANGFTLNWQDQNSSFATQILYLALA